MENQFSGVAQILREVGVPGPVSSMVEPRSERSSGCSVESSLETGEQDPVPRPDAAWGAVVEVWIHWVGAGETEWVTADITVGLSKSTRAFHVLRWRSGRGRRQPSCGGHRNWACAPGFRAEALGQMGQAAGSFQCLCDEGQ